MLTVIQTKHAVGRDGEARTYGRRLNRMYEYVRESESNTLVQLRTESVSKQRQNEREKCVTKERKRGNVY